MFLIIAHHHDITTNLHAVFLLVSHGATVLTCSLPELGGCLALDDASFIPLIESTVLLLFLFLGTLMLQRWSTSGKVGRRKSLLAMQGKQQGEAII